MNNRKKGFSLAILGCVLWGGCGTAAQYLFEHLPGLSSTWLVGVRLVGAGILLIIWCLLSNWKAAFAIFRKPKDALLLIFFGLAGMLTSQLTYFTAIKYGNAPTAAILQFLGPLFIIIYLAIRQWQLPSRIDVISVTIAFIGTYLLVTHGQWGKLALSPKALIWGILAGVSQAFYTLIPVGLLRRFDSRIVTGWSMVIGGLAFVPTLVHTKIPNIHGTEWLMLGYIVVFGTMFAYLTYLLSLKYIDATTTGMLSAFEPLTATILSVVLLSTPFGPAEIAGGILILATAFLQALPVRRLPQR